MRFSLASLFLAVCLAALLVAFVQGNVPGLLIGGFIASLLMGAWAEAKFGGGKPR